MKGPLLHNLPIVGRVVGLAYPPQQDVTIATPLAQIDYTDVGDVDSFARASVAGYTGNGQAAFQLEAAVDVLRSAHYVGSDPTVLLEDTITDCALVAPGVPSVTPGAGKFSATYTAIAVTTSLLRYEYRIDAGSWVSNTTNLTLTDVTASAGDHTLSVRAVSTGGVAGAVATSATFTVTSGETLVINQGSRNDNFSGSDTVPVTQGLEIATPTTFSRFKVNVWEVSGAATFHLELRTAPNGGGSLIATSETKSALASAAATIDDGVELNFPSPAECTTDAFLTYVGEGGGFNVGISNGNPYSTTSYFGYQGGSTFSDYDVQMKGWAI